MPALHRRQGAPMTTTANTSAGAHGRTPAWLPADPRWEEQKARLWAMTVDERVREMHAGELSMRLCLHWASVGRPRWRSATASSHSLRSTPPRWPTTADSASPSPSHSFAARPARHAASTARAAAKPSAPRERPGSPVASGRSCGESLTTSRWRLPAGSSPARQRSPPQARTSSSPPGSARPAHLARRTARPHTRARACSSTPASSTPRSAT